LQLGAKDLKNTIAEMENVSFKYGDTLVLDSVFLKIEKGDFLGIIGPNGSGKTTLLKLFLGILKPDKGKVKLFGKNIEKFKEWDKIAYIPQKATNFDQNFPATVFEIVSMGRFPKLGAFKNLDKHDLKKIEHSLNLVGLLEKKDEFIGSLSGGQQQRVFIAKALCQEPELIFLDEPTTGVDSNSQKNFYEILKKLNKELKITLVLVSHDVSAASEQINKLACVNQKVIFHDLKKDKKHHLLCNYAKGTKSILHDSELYA